MRQLSSERSDDGDGTQPSQFSANYSSQPSPMIPALDSNPGPNQGLGI